MATVVAIGTLDTKGAEYGFLRERPLEHGVDVIQAIHDAAVGLPTELAITETLRRFKALRP